MTTPDGLAAESEARLETWARHLTPDYLDFLRETLVIAEAAALARHVRDTGCDGLREAAQELVRVWWTSGLSLPALSFVMGKLEDALAAPAASPEEEDWMGPVVLSESSPATVREVPYAGMTFVDEDQPATASAAATSEEGGRG